MKTEIHWKGQQESDVSVPSTAPKGSVGSYGTQSTAPTEYSRPTYIPRSETCYGRLEGRGADEHKRSGNDGPSDSQSSVGTYTSTIASQEEVDEVPLEPEFDIGTQPRPINPTFAIPATPRDFAEAFPASKRLLIGHDDSTSDGNMNLRLDTEVLVNGSKRLLTLFHLRMYDLRDREMSLRRYCRDSGREVCRSRRVHQDASAKSKSALHKKLGGALANLRHRSGGSKDSISGVKRHDSGYESSPALADLETSSLSSAGSSSKTLPATNNIKLDFSNYAHVSLKRRGPSAGQGKRYEFEYWGHFYEWKRDIVGHESGEEVSFHLFRSDSDVEIARINPLHLSEAQASRERRNGGWIPPCTMELLGDRKWRSPQDVADVIVSTGLIALVDDALKRRCGSKRSHPLSIPLYRSASFRMNMELVGPKRFLNEAFNRPGHNRATSDTPASLRRVPLEA